MGDSDGEELLAVKNNMLPFGKGSQLKSFTGNII